jgi:GTP diphosphokinase / guanosine-3',5'-bis(diphosphate) 3'-diphosphatase
MQEKRHSFKEVVDVFAVRIVVADVDTCYRALGVVHNLYKPVPGRFKDYIAIPKSNGYQSLHTVLFGPHGSPIEVQIRSAEMDRVAESGIAAHWQYKAGTDLAMTAQSRARDWLKDVLEIQNSVGSSIEFLENVKIDLFPDEVYTFTPMGEIMVLPRGATPIDFAYAVHSDVGNHCVAAKVDRQLAPLSARLQSGQTVEIVTAKGARPNPAWLSFVITGKARSGIRHSLKTLQTDEAMVLGRRLMEKALSTLGQSLGQLSPVRLNQVLDEMKLPDIDGLLVEIGLGNRMATLVARQLVGTGSVGRTRSALRRHRLRAGGPGHRGAGRQLRALLPPDPGRPGHRPAQRRPRTGGAPGELSQCRRAARARGPHRGTGVVQRSGAEFAVSIRAQTANRRGALAEMASVIADHGSNIEHITFNERDGHSTAITFTITVRDRHHLAQIIRSLRRLNDVLRVQRARG